MQGVAGGVSPRSLEAGQAPVVDRNLLSASTALQQSGGGAYQKLVDALQSLNQVENILSLSGNIAGITTEITTLQGQVATLQSQVTSINGQIGIINTRLDQLANSINNLTTQLGGYQFGPPAGVPAGAITGSIPTTEPGGAVVAIPTYA